ncbi:MAG: hypothetical protein QXJ24_06810, partial [Thermoplasmatales archaeon]
VDVFAYGAREEEKSPPPPPPPENLTNLTKPNQAPVRRENENSIGVSGAPNHLTGDFHTHEGVSGEEVPHENNKNVVRWLGVPEEGNVFSSTNLTSDRLGSVRSVRITDEYLNSINKVKEFLTEYELHGRIDTEDGLVFIDVHPFSEVAHWINTKLNELGFRPFQSDRPNQIILRYVEAQK